MVMIQVQTADEDRLLGAVQLAFDQAIVGNKPRTGACRGSETEFARERSARQRELVPEREYWSVSPWRHVCGTLQTDRAGPGGGIPAKHRAAQTCVPRGSGDRLALVLSATARAGVSCITSCPRWRSPGCGTALSAGSSLE